MSVSPCYLKWFSCICFQLMSIVCVHICWKSREKYSIVCLCGRDWVYKDHMRFGFINLCVVGSYNRDAWLTLEKNVLCHPTISLLSRLTIVWSIWACEWHEKALHAHTGIKHTGINTTVTVLRDVNYWNDSEDGDGACFLVVFVIASVENSREFRDFCSAEIYHNKWEHYGCREIFFF